MSGELLMKELAIPKMFFSIGLSFDI